MKIWVDADACPLRVREVIYKASSRVQAQVVLVSNKNMYIPRTPLISLIVVDDGFDAADHYIVANSKAGDLAITSDILLAGLLVNNGLSVINSVGKVYNKENVKEAVAMRNLFQELREGRIIQGGPPPFSPKDLQNFANAFDRELSRLMRS